MRRLLVLAALVLAGCSMHRSAYNGMSVDSLSEAVSALDELPIGSYADVTDGFTIRERVTKLRGEYMVESSLSKSTVIIPAEAAR